MKEAGRPVRFGILGAGRIAGKFCAAARLVPGAEVVAAAGNTPGKARAFAEENGVESWYEGYDALLARPDIDAVYVATTNNFHHANLMQALEAGKHVLCEKPFTPTRREAAEAFALAEKKGLFCMEAMWSRFLLPIQQAKKWIQAGAIGRPELASFSIGFRADPDPAGRMYNPALAGGALLDLGVYAIELTDYLIPEELRAVEARLTRAGTGVDKTASLTLAYDSCIAELQCTMTCAMHQSLQIYGDGGSIVIPNPHHSDTVERFGRTGERVEHCYFRLENGFEYEIQETVDCIRAGRLESAVVPHADTLRCAGIFDQCLDPAFVPAPDGSGGRGQKE